MLTNVKNHILVYETIDYKLVYCFRQHPCLVRQFLYIEETREVISSSDAQDLFLWQVIDSDKKTGKGNVKAHVYGHNSHEMYLDFDYCAALDLFLGCTISRTFVLYGDKCQVHLTNFCSPNFNVSCLKIDRGSDIILAGTTQGGILLFSLVHIFQVLQGKIPEKGGSRSKVLKQICERLGFFEEIEGDRMQEQGYATAFLKAHDNSWKQVGKQRE